MSKNLTIRPGTLLAPQLDYILVDGSSSMQSIWWDCLAALDNFMGTLRAQNIASHGIVHVFSGDDMKSIQRDGKIGDWKSFSEDPLGSVWGVTPLYDAINLMGRELKALDPPRCSIVIITDGDEQGSTHTTLDQAKAILDWCRAKGWQVTFLGADFANSRQAKLLGANAENSVGVRKQLLAAAGKSLGEKRVKNALFGEDINFNEDERKNFGGLLTDGSNGK